VIAPNLRSHNATIVARLVTWLVIAQRGAAVGVEVEIAATIVVNLDILLVIVQKNVRKGLKTNPVTAVTWFADLC
jgi:hypothetical protein